MSSSALAVPALLGAAVAGAMTWSLAEYLLHRFLGHDRRTAPNFFAHEHTRHHSQGDYFAPTWKKVIAAVVMTGASTALLAVVVDVGVAVAFSVGFGGFYAAYEVLHRRLHTHRGIGWLGRFWRRHHFHHHFHNPKCNHGVTSPLWDIVFGTLEHPAVVVVPERLAMQWLVDPLTGDVAADVAPHFALRRAASH
jgi:sterol desaturase/sphingolipid hydroxylase (fatty acid hydroxylase superfamily)